MIHRRTGESVRSEGKIFAAWLAGCAVFAAIFLHRSDVLFSPPYTEQSVSHWGEADWLVENDFDYRKLRVEMLHFEVGGPRVYWCSVFPTVMAAAMRWDPPPAVFIAAYRVLFVWVPAALVLVLAFTMVRERAGVWIAALVAACIYAAPIFSVQVEMLGMDVAMTAAAMLWWRAMDGRRFWTAAALGVLPFFLKPSAFVVPLAAASYFTLAALLAAAAPSRPPSLRRDWTLALVNFAVFALQIYLLVIGGNLHGRVMLFTGLGLWLRSSPDLLLAVAAAMLAAILSMAREIPFPRTRDATPGVLAAWADWTRRKPLELTGWFTILLNLAAAAVTYYESRHLTLVVPFVFVLLGRAVGPLPYPNLASACLLAFLAFSAANASGRLYPPLQPPVQRGWGVLERSLEYRKDHESNIAAARLLDEQIHGEPMLVADQFLYFLKLPRLGYVSERFGLNDYCYIARDENVLRIVEDQPDTLVVTHVACQLGDWPFPAYVVAAPNEDDEILYNDHLEPPTVVYRRRFPKSESKAENMRRYVDLLFSDAASVDPAVRLAVVGAERLALEFVAAEIGGAPNDPEVRRELIRRVQRYYASLEGAPSPLREDFLNWRLRRIARMRLEELEAGNPLEPLPWRLRTMFDTWPLRWQYFPPEQTRPRPAPTVQPSPSAGLHATGRP
jgi:hypothetical protein